MSRQSRLLVGFLSQIVITTICTSGALSQAAWETNKVVACQADGETHSLLLSTAKRTALPAPSVSYLPGDDGEFIMVADFSGLVWSLPTRVLRAQPSSKAHGIEEIRIGCFSESPPICRISITADNPNAFKALSFKAKPGSLSISWAGNHRQPLPAIAPGSNSRVKQPARYVPPSASETQSAPAKTNTISTGSGLQTWSSSNLSNAQTNAQTSPQKNLALRPPLPLSGTNNSGNENDTAPLQTTATMPQVAPNFKSARRPNINAENAERPIEIAVDTKSSRKDNGPECLKLAIKATHPFSYNTFRLHSPERYVVDFSNCPELINAQLPDVSQNTFVRSIRIGQPDDDQKTRLVLDLTDTPVSVKEEILDSSSRLGLTLLGGDQIDTKAPITAAQEIVPMPSNFSHLRIPRDTLIVLDAGHGGTDPGAQRGEVQEKEITMDIIEKLKKVLEAKGARVVLTRSDDTFVSLEDRVRITNNTAPTLFLSVHINAMESASDIHGIETYYQTEQSRLLADAVHECLISNLAAPDRSVRKARFYVIKNTPVPAILAEVGFISNQAERDKLISSDYQMKIAEALEHGVILYLDRKLALKKSNTYTKTTENLPSANGTTATAGTIQSSPRSNSSNQTTMQRIAQSRRKNADDELR
ncbi:MAG: N-acetylmuramoyl-L-alanine amidase [Candidatus Obscuribacterales bacterium]|nr:N-acetylmuramoyl-L-alanine amidase [Candidatus Obscuribacterales bacterium]